MTQEGQTRAGESDFQWELPKMPVNTQGDDRWQLDLGVWHSGQRSRPGMEMWAQDGTYSQGADEISGIGRLLCRAAWGLNGIRYVLRGPALLQEALVPERPHCIHFGGWRGEEKEDCSIITTGSNYSYYQLKSLCCFLIGCH